MGALEIAEQQYLYELMVEDVMMFWEESMYSGNEGQAAIAEYYVLPASENALAQLRSGWPDVGPEQYYDWVISAHWTMDDTWSYTTDEATAIVEGYIDAAQTIGDGALETEE